MIDLERLKLVQATGVGDRKLEIQKLIEPLGDKYALTTAGKIAVQLKRVGNVLTGRIALDEQTHDVVIIGVPLKPNVIAYYYWGANHQHEGTCSSEWDACQRIRIALEGEQLETQ